MKSNYIIFQSLLALFFSTLGINSLLSQTIVNIGQIQNGAPVLTITDAQFNTQMAALFPGRNYSNLQLLSGSDVNGQYYYVKCAVQQTGGAFPVIIVLKQSGSNIDFNSNEGCEMKCTWTGDCTGCDQEIIEKCKSQRCICNGTSGGTGFGGCSSSIAFPE